MAAFSYSVHYTGYMLLMDGDQKVTFILLWVRPWESISRHNGKNDYLFLDFELDTVMMVFGNVTWERVIMSVRRKKGPYTDDPLQ